MGFTATGCALVGCADAGGVRVVRLGHGLDRTHPVHAGMEHMSERLATLSGGAMRVDLYPSQQLGTERECLELLQIGSLGITKVSASVLENFAPDFAVFGLPYLFRDEAHLFAVQDAPVGRRLLDETAPYGIRGLAYYDAGQRSFYTVRRPVLRPEDLAGLKIRTQESQTAIRMVRALGGSPTPISYGELYTALQQGVVDGAENNPPSFHLSRHYEVARHYSLDEHTAVPDVLLVSERLWQRLSAQERAWLRQAAEESAVFQRERWREATAEALAAVEAAGVTIHRPDKAPFAERVAGQIEGLRAERPGLYALVEEIRQTGAAAPLAAAAP